MEPFLGQIQPFGFNFAPRGWAMCDGQLLPIAQNTALFSLLGTTFGGDGRTTFALPDLRGRVIKHIGTGAGLIPVRWGQRGGAETVTLNVAHIPAHNHLMFVNDSGGLEDDPAGRVIGNAGLAAFNDAANGKTLKSDAIANTGGGQAFGIDNPYLGINVCIAMTGLFPSRS